MTRLSRALAAVLVASAAGVAASAAQAQAIDERTVKVIIDRAKVVRIPRPADTVIIGNPGIADAVLQDARTLVLTGRSTGVTNLIILDEEGDPIVDETIVVGNSEQSTVRVYARASRRTLACAPVCEGVLAPGDAPEYFGTVAEQTQQRAALSQQN